MDGHNRYTIAKKHPEIPFTVHEKEFASRYEAIIWICKNQLGRRNLTPEQKKYLIGKQYETEKQIRSFQGNQHTAVVSYENRNSPQVEKDRTCHRIAEENGVGRSYVIDAEKYAAGIDQIEEIQPGMKESILTRKQKQPLPRSHPLPVPLPKNVLHLWLKSASRSPQNRLHKSRKLPQP